VSVIEARAKIIGVAATRAHEPIGIEANPVGVSKDCIPMSPSAIIARESFRPLGTAPAKTIGSQLGLSKKD